MTLGDSGWERSCVLQHFHAALMITITTQSKNNQCWKPLLTVSCWMKQVGGYMGAGTDENMRDACIDKANNGWAIRTTHCPDCRSFSLTTAQLVSDSSSVGHRAACMVCEERGRGGWVEEKMTDTFQYMLYLLKRVHQTWTLSERKCSNDNSLYVYTMILRLYSVAVVPRWAAG